MGFIDNRWVMAGFLKHQQYDPYEKYNVYHYLGEFTVQLQHRGTGHQESEETTLTAVYRVAVDVRMPRIDLGAWPIVGCRGREGKGAILRCIFLKAPSITRWWQLKYFFFSPLKIGEDSHFDSYFSDGLKRPSR